jgi:glutamyl-tRNA reductase
MPAVTGSSSDPNTAPRLERVIIAGVDHLTAGQGLRDRLFVEEAALPNFYRRLGEAGLGEGVLLSTCDRVVVVGVTDEPDAAAAAIRRTLAETAGIPSHDIEGSFFIRTGTEAIGHLFAIAASLESQVVGEPEVLGQIKTAHRQAENATVVGRELASIFEAAYSVAKRVRNETAIGENAVSMAAAGCQVAREVLGRFEGTTALVVGAGELGVLVAEKLKAQGLTDIWVADPLEPRGEALAARLGAHRLAMEEIGPSLHRMDMVLTGLGGAVPVIARDDAAAALKQRRYKPIFMLDAAVPADVDPDVAALDEAYLFTLHDLERIALTGQEKRSHAAMDARSVVEDEVASFVLAEGHRAAAPLVTALRQSFEAHRQQILASNPEMSADDATRLLVNRLLHGPSQALRELAAESDGGEESVLHDGDLIARLFGLAAGAEEIDPPGGGKEKK